MCTKRLSFTGVMVSVALLAVVAVLMLFSLQPVQASPGILYVISSGNCGGVNPCYSTIQAAVDAATLGDEIRVAAGTYPIQSGLDQVVLVDKNLTIKGGYTTGDWSTPDPQANPTILNALSQGRVMVITGTANVTVEGLRLIYGSADAGGGLYVSHATLHLSRTWVMTNTTSTDGSGGGVYIGNGSGESVIEQSLIQGNHAGFGCGVYVYGTQATFNDNLIQNNTSGAFGGKGGGVRISSGNVTLYDNHIRDNVMTNMSYGGGVAIGGGAATLISNTIEDNTVLGWGGGVFVDDATALLDRNTIHGNLSMHGGGLYAWNSSTITMMHNTVSDNDSRQAGDQKGGGIYIDGGHACLEHNAVQGNEARYGGGAYLIGGQSIILRDNVIQDNYVTSSWGGAGGGVYVDGGGIVLEGNTVQSNQAQAGTLPSSPGNGGGIYIYVSNAQVGDGATFTNNIVTNNQVGGAGSGGPGIRVVGASPNFYHNTIANNTGGEGSGIYVRENSSTGQPGQPILYNTIIVSQTVGVLVTSGSPQNLATLYGILWSGNGTNTSGTVFIFDEVAGNPAFVNPTGYDYHLGPGSAAIDAGRTDAGITTDVDGQSRPHYAGYDLGADEWWPLVAVKTVTPDTAEPGEVVTYTLTLTNATPTPMTVRLTDTLPTEVDYLGPLLYNNGAGSYASGVIIWTGDVLTTTPTLITWAVEIEPDVASGTTITNAAIVSDAYGLFQTDPALIMLPQHCLYLPLVVRNYP